MYTCPVIFGLNDVFSYYLLSFISRNHWSTSIIFSQIMQHLNFSTAYWFCGFFNLICPFTVSQRPSYLETWTIHRCFLCQAEFSICLSAFTFLITSCFTVIVLVFQLSSKYHCISPVPWPHRTARFCSLTVYDSTSLDQLAAFFCLDLIEPPVSGQLEWLLQPRLWKQPSDRSTWMRSGEPCCLLSSADLLLSVWVNVYISAA